MIKHNCFLLPMSNAPQSSFANLKKSLLKTEKFPKRSFLLPENIYNSKCILLLLQIMHYRIKILK